MTHGHGRRSPARSDAFTDAYVEAALWSTNDESDDRGGEPLDKNYSADDIAPDTLRVMQRDCADFQQRYVRLIEDDESGDIEKHGRWELAGHDFWLTRNGHGAGFWDGGWPKHGDELTRAAKSYGTFDLYVGDDGQIHGSGFGHDGTTQEASRRRSPTTGRRSPVQPTKRHERPSLTMSRDAVMRIATDLSRKLHGSAPKYVEGGHRWGQRNESATFATRSPEHQQPVIVLVSVFEDRTVALDFFSSESMSETNRYENVGHFLYGPGGFTSRTVDVAEMESDVRWVWKTVDDYAESWQEGERGDLDEARTTVADFDTRQDLVEHERAAGATHVHAVGSGVTLYYPMRGGQYAENRAWKQNGYWHGHAPSDRVVVDRLPAGAEPIETFLARSGVGRRAAEEPRQVRDYVAVDNRGRRIAGPSKRYDEMKREADRAGGYVQFAVEVRDSTHRRKVTVRSVTDRDLRNLRDEAGQAGDFVMAVIADVALGTPFNPDDWTTLDRRDEARVRQLAPTQDAAVRVCVDAINGVPFSVGVSEAGRARGVRKVRALHPGAQYADDQVNSDHFRDWMWDQMTEAEAMRQRDPSSVMPLESKADYAKLARNMLEQLDHDIRRNIEPRELDDLVGDSDPNSMAVMEFFADLRQRLRDKDMIDWVAGEVEAIQEEVTATRTRRRESRPYARETSGRRTRWLDWMILDAIDRGHMMTPEAEERARELAQLGYVDTAGTWRLTPKGHRAVEQKLSILQDVLPTGRFGAIRRPEGSETRAGMYHYGTGRKSATIWVSGPVGGTWWATVKFMNQEVDLDDRTLTGVLEKAIEWVDAAPEHGPREATRARRPATRRNPLSHRREDDASVQRLSNGLSIKWRKVQPESRGEYGGFIGKVSDGSEYHLNQSASGKFSLYYFSPSGAGPSDMGKYGSLQSAKNAIESGS